MTEMEQRVYRIMKTNQPPPGGWWTPGQVAEMIRKEESPRMRAVRVSPQDIKQVQAAVAGLGRAGYVECKQGACRLID